MIHSVFVSVSILNLWLVSTHRMNSRNTTVQLCPGSVYPHSRQNAFLLSWLNFVQNAIKINFFSEKTTIFLDWDISIGVRIFEVSVHFYRDSFFRIRISISQYYCEQIMMTVMKIVRASARLLLANTCLCKMQLELILFKPIMSGSGQPTGKRLIYEQNKYSLQCYQGVEAGVCHFRAERSVHCHFL